jgi:hypothetical protein
MLARTIGARNEVREIASVSGVCQEFEAAVWGDGRALPHDCKPSTPIPTAAPSSRRFWTRRKQEPLCAEIMTRVIDTLAEDCRG